jgi:hypothetical protein
LGSLIRLIKHQKTENTKKIKAMKKYIVTLAATLCFGLSAALASNGGGEETKLMKSSFERDFSNVKEVTWDIQKEYAKAKFTLNNQIMYAYYKPSGELMAVVRYMLTDHLPIDLQMQLKKNYTGYWVSDLFELAADNQTSYYLSLENGEETIVLQSSGMNQWTVYKRTRKVVM